MKLIVFSALLALCNATPLKLDWQCGKPAINPNAPDLVHTYYELGPVESVPHSWPWNGLLVRGEDQSYTVTLIHPQWVMTLAQPFVNQHWTPKNVKIRLGVHDRSNSDEQSQIVVDVAEIHIHPNYAASNFTRSDISLIKLKEPVTMKREISPICLPKVDNELPPVGYNMWMTGYSFAKSPEAPNQKLKQLVTSIAPKETCSNTYGDMFDEPTSFCVGPDTTNNGICSDDSASPAVYFDKERERWVQHGIAAIYAGCGEVYPLLMKVSGALNFIHKTIKF